MTATTNQDDAKFCENLAVPESEKAMIKVRPRDPCVSWSDINRAAISRESSPALHSPIRDNGRVNTSPLASIDEFTMVNRLVERSRSIDRWTHLMTTFPVGFM